MGDSKRDQAAKAYPARGLSEWMLGQFTDPGGLLHRVLVAVRDDPRLDLQIRHRYVNIYYRGTNLMRIAETGRGGKHLTAYFEPLYLPDPDPSKRSATWKKRGPTAEETEVHDWLRRHAVLGTRSLATSDDVSLHIASMPYRIEAMDASKHEDRRPNKEKDLQQQMVRLNNDSAESEYLICDVEYAFKYADPAEPRPVVGRIDLVAAHRSISGDPEDPARLSLIELKYGPNAVDGTAGLQKHVKDLRGLLGGHDPAETAEEMVAIVKQKHKLGTVLSTLPGFDHSAPVEYVIAVGANNPRSQRLHDALVGNDDRDEGRLEWPDNVEAKVAILGDSLFLRSEAMIPFEEIVFGSVPPSIFHGGKLKDRRPRSKR